MTMREPQAQLEETRETEVNMMVWVGVLLR